MIYRDGYYVLMKKRKRLYENKFNSYSMQKNYVWKIPFFTRERGLILKKLKGLLSLIICGETEGKAK